MDIYVVIGYYYDEAELEYVGLDKIKAKSILDDFLARIKDDDEYGGWHRVESQIWRDGTLQEEKYYS